MEDGVKTTTLLSIFLILLFITSYCGCLDSDDKKSTNLEKVDIHISMTNETIDYTDQKIIINLTLFNNGTKNIKNADSCYTLVLVDPNGTEIECFNKNLTSDTIEHKNRYNSTELFLSNFYYDIKNKTNIGKLQTGKYQIYAVYKSQNNSRLKELPYSLVTSNIIQFEIVDKSILISGIVIDELTSNPILGAFVGLYAHIYTHSIPYTDVIFNMSTTTDAQGKFIFNLSKSKAITCDLFYLSVKKQFYFNNGSWDVNYIEKNEPIFNNIIKITPGATIEGYIVDDNGNPINHAIITSTIYTKAIQNQSKFIRGFYNDFDCILETDSNGYYHSEVIPLGNTYIFCYNQDFSSYLLINNLTFGKNTLDFKLSDVCYNYSVNGKFIGYNVYDRETQGMGGVVYNSSGKIVAAVLSNNQSEYTFKVDECGTYYLYAGRNTGHSWYDTYTEITITNSTKYLDIEFMIGVADR